MRRPVSRLAALAVATGLLAGCNQYEMFRLAGAVQEDFSNDAEILFVIDNSGSMRQASSDLGVNFDRFIDQLVDPTGDGSGTDGLPDAVDDYILSVDERGGVIDFQLGITSTDVGAEHGQLFDASGTQVIRRSTPEVADAFRQNLLCDATCFTGANGGLPSASEVGRDGYTCGDPLDSDELFFEYMDCLCGEDVWRDNCGTGTEEHLESALLAMCRGLDPSDQSDANQLLLEECADDGQNPFDPAADGGTNAELFREGSTVIPVIVTDASDLSRRLRQGEADVSEYLDLFGAFNRRMSWAVIAPTTEGCRIPGSTESPSSWGLQRFDTMVDDSRGLYADICTRAGEGGEAQVSDFALILEELGQLLNRLLEIFPLQAVPEVETIRVSVDGSSVEQAVEERDEDGNIVFGTGWSYVPAENAVQFHGDAVPDYNARVRITYRPLQGQPRTLPFTDPNASAADE
jgi:hypothetical protein